jgi:hypothetical protein
MHPTSLKIALPEFYLGTSARLSGGLRAGTVTGVMVLNFLTAVVLHQNV